MVSPKRFGHGSHGSVAERLPDLGRSPPQSCQVFDLLGGFGHGSHGSVAERRADSVGMGHKVFEVPPIATEGSGRVTFTPQDVPLDVDATPPARIERRRARKNYQSEPSTSPPLAVKAYHHVV